MNENRTTRQMILSRLIKARRLGTTVSGAKLAGELGISRNAVWKAVGSLQKEGFDIRSEHRRGYYLAAPADILDEAEIRSGIRSHAIPDDALRLAVFDSIDSTNNYAKAQPVAGPALAVTSDEQTGGRGRLGRSFSSPKGTGIYLTYSFRPEFPIREVTDVTSIAAVITHQVLSEISGEKLGIKWVNDIYKENLKICGILTEALGGLESGSFERIIIGIGLNCLKGGIPEGLEGTAGTLTGLDEPGFTRNQILGELISRLHLAMDHKKTLSAAQYLDYYRANCFILGKEIQVIESGRDPYPAVAEEIGDHFELTVRNRNGELRTLTGGEVSLRL